MNLYLQCLLAAAGLFTLVFLLATALKNNSIVDSFWGLGFIVVGYVCILRVADILESPDLGWKDRLPFFTILGLIMIWGVRLSLHIARRNANKAEDFRYAAWRKQWGKTLIPRAFLQIFMLQALLLWVISLPLQYTAVHVNAGQLDVIGLGIAIWLVGFAFEAVGDWQLRQFIRDPKNKGKIMQSGLWSRTRHPNYFGEATMWWGIFVISLSSRPPALSLIVSPVLITLLLRFVSGVPMLEAKYKGNKTYQKYAKKTPALFPRLF